MAKSLGKPNIKKAESIDAILGLDKMVKDVELLAIDKLHHFEEHPFTLYYGERMDDLVESIRANGVIVPIIVRTKPKGEFEIVSGHNRAEASRIAGLEEIPAIVLNDLTDDKALAYVIETNLMQRSFGDMSHSEKAAVLSLHYSKMFSQGKRSDILTEIRLLSGVVDDTDKNTDEAINGSDVVTPEGGHSRSVLGEKYELNARTVSRYLRIVHLTRELKELLDDGILGFIHAVQVSYLSEEEQGYVADCFNRENLKLDSKKVKELRAKSANNELGKFEVFKIMSGMADGVTLRSPSVRIDPNTYSRFFSDDTKKEDVEGIVEKALIMYFEANPDEVTADDTDEDEDDYI